MAEQKKRKYQSETLGTPALSMVLVHTENDRRNKALRPIQKPKFGLQRTDVKQEDLIRIIQHLKMDAQN